MFKKFLLYILSFVLIFQVTSVSKITVHASGSLSVFNEWSEDDKKMFWQEHWVSIVAQCVGIMINPSLLSYNDFMTMFEDISADKITADESANYEEYIIKRLNLDDNGNLVVNNELSDLLYETSVNYIEEESGFFIHTTADARSYIKNYTDIFETNSQYQSFLAHCNALPSTTLVFVPQFKLTSHTDTNNSENSFTNGFVFREVDISELLILDSTYNYNSGHLAKFYSSDWVDVTLETLEQKVVLSDGTIINHPSGNNDYAIYWPYGYQEQYYSYSWHYYYNYYFYDNIPLNLKEGFSAHLIEDCIILTSTPSQVRIYKTLSDLKTYSVGQRPYYVTEKFVNYDSTVDNSTTITQTEIDNSITYGDVYNYIINNYDNPDGLTEAELIAILEKYFGGSDDDDDGGGSGSGGSSDDDDDGGGSGLSGFLDGLGALGDALLAIVGKLLEYVGKAIELLSGTVTKVIDLVPQNITSLISGLFPFIPQEWLVAIELSLVLAVVIGIVGIFKK